jgi:hypothetical protein
MTSILTRVNTSSSSTRDDYTGRKLAKCENKPDADTKKAIQWVLTGTSYCDSTSAYDDADLQRCRRHSDYYYYHAAAAGHMIIRQGPNKQAQPQKRCGRVTTSWWQSQYAIRVLISLLGYKGISFQMSDDGEGSER